jgi:hypothetical protein
LKFLGTLNISKLTANTLHAFYKFAVFFHMWGWSNEETPSSVEKV